MNRPQILMERAKEIIAAQFPEMLAGPDAVLPAVAFVGLSGGAWTMIDFKTLSDEQQRSFLQGLLPRMGATAVTIVQEVWIAKAETPAQMALSMSLRQVGRLEDAPEDMLEEGIRIWVETPADGTFSAVAVIHRDSERRRTLGEWEEATLKAPSPGFRRYFPCQVARTSEVADA
jgi:hypothetical protein